MQQNRKGSHRGVPTHLKAVHVSVSCGDRSSLSQSPASLSCTLSLSLTFPLGSSTCVLALALALALTTPASTYSPFPPLSNRAPWACLACVSLVVQPLYCRSTDADEFWPMLLEKAYAKAHGCYESIAGGAEEYALKDLTGGLPETIQLVRRGRCLPLNLVVLRRCCYGGGVGLCVCLRECCVER